MLVPVINRVRISTSLEISISKKFSIYRLLALHFNESNKLGSPTQSHLREFFYESL